MKILLITHYDNLYGANNALLKIVVKLKENGDTPIVVIPGEGAFADKLKEHEIEYYVCNITQWLSMYTTPLRFFVKKCQRKPHIKKEVEKLFNRFKNENIDIIHSNSSVVIHGALLAKKLNCKHIWHIREFAKEHFNMHCFYNKSVEVSLFYEADKLITISDALKENYQAKYPEANIVRIYDGVDIDNNINENAIAAEENSNVKFACVGYLFPMKHQLEVIKACKKLYDSGTTNFEMHFIGDGKEDYVCLLKREIPEYMNNNIVMHGYVKNVSEMLSTMDVGLIASEYEGFGLVTVEYMLTKLPVIGKNSGGTSEIVANNVTGFVYDNEQELIAYMQKLIEDSQLRKQMGQQGYERAVTTFTEEKYTNAVLTLYKELSQ